MNIEHQGANISADHLSSARRAYIIDDHSDFRRSLHFSLATAEIVGWSFASARDFLDEVGSLPPAPILLDVRMPDIDGLEVLACLREQGIHWPVIMMSAHGDIPIAVKSIRLGAVDFLEKPFKLEELEALLGTAFDYLSQTGSGKLTKLKAQKMLASLAPRETEVMGLLVKGLSNKNIASEIGLSVRTVEVYRLGALKKLGVKSLPEALAIMFAAKGQILEMQ